MWLREPPEEEAARLERQNETLTKLNQGLVAENRALRTEIQKLEAKPKKLPPSPPKSPAPPPPGPPKTPPFFQAFNGCGIGFAATPAIALTEKVETLDLSVRGRKAMRKLGVRTVGDLVQLTSDDVLGAKNCGMTTLNEIRQKLAQRHLTLKDDRP